MLGTVFNIQRFSLFDGPGVRTVIFLKGCPLRCVWCHNPEGLLPQPQVLFNSLRCIACGDCVPACPMGLHSLQNGTHMLERAGCTGCGKCADACPAEALTIAGIKMDAQYVINEALKDIQVFRESGGGITLSGGEPLYQAEFAAEILSLAKKAGVSTCVETSGFGAPEKLALLIPDTDIFLFDYKATGDAEHRRLCGGSAHTVARSLQQINRAGVPVVLRCPIVPGLNNTQEHLRGIAETANRYACIGEIQLEPYHRLGVSKAEKLGGEPGYDTQPPQHSLMEEYCSLVAQFTQKKVSIS